MLQALLAWRRTRDADAHVKLLDTASEIHLKGLVERPPASVFEHYARLDPDWLLEVQLTLHYVTHPITFHPITLHYTFHHIPSQSITQSTVTG